MDISQFSRDELTLLGSGACTMLALHFSFQLASQHLYFWKNPKEQKAIIIIILMAPVYAMNSFVGVLDVKGSKPFFMLLDSIKECYEALVCDFFIRFISFDPSTFTWILKDDHWIFISRSLLSFWIYFIAT